MQQFQKHAEYQLAVAHRQQELMESVDWTVVSEQYIGYKEVSKESTKGTRSARALSHLRTVTLPMFLPG